MQLRHDAVLAAIDAVLERLGARSLAAGTRTPNVIPVAISLWSGIYNVCFSLKVRAPLVLIDRFEAPAFARFVKEYEIKSSVLAPAMLTMLLDDPSIADLSPLRIVRSISAPLSPHEARRFHERFGVVVLNGYGQTELGGEVIGWSAKDAREFGEQKLGSIGRPHPGVGVRILADDGTDVVRGEIGEICVRSPFVMAGYLGGEPATDRLVGDHLRTGDLGLVDEDGFVWIEGRRSDMINRGGLKVQPAEVEEVLRTSPEVVDVAVAGVPDPRLGEVPVAFVVLRRPDDNEIDPDEAERIASLRELARTELAPYKVPVRFVALDSLPRNDMGKVLRRELVALVRGQGKLMTDGGALEIDSSTTPDDVSRIVRRWIETTVPPAWRRAAAHGIQALREVRSRADYEAWYPRFASSGLVVPTWPREYGGLAVGAATSRVIAAELAPLHLGRLNPLGLNLAGPTLLAWGTDAQRARYLLPIVRNEERWCQFFSEPGAGSDLPSLATRGERDGDEWVITGQKVWSTWAHEAEFGLLLARTDPQVPKREGITMFIVALRSPGVEVRPLRQMTGDADFNEGFFDGVRVPDDMRIGDVNVGWSVARTTLSGERQWVGGGEGAGERLGGRSLDRLVERLRTAGRTAEPIVRQRLTVLLCAERVIAWTAARARDARSAGRSPGPETSIGKLMSTEHNQRLQEAWIDLTAGVAHEDGDPDAEGVVYGFLRSRANSIEGGTSEIQRNTIGERVLGLPVEPDPFRGLAWEQVPRS